MREGWTYKKLGEITKVINGLWIGKKPPLKTVAVIRNTNFTKDCKLSTTNIAYIDVEEKQFEKRRLLQGDIIIEKSGGSEKQPVGRPILFNLIGGEFSFSNFTSVIRIDNPNEIISSFLHLALYGAYLRGETLKMQAKTTGIHNLDFKAYNRILIPIPSLQEQQQIVSELDLLSSVIEKQKAQIEELDKLAQSIFYDMFGDPVENEKVWEVKKLGEVCVHITDGDHMPPPKADKGIPFITISNIDKDGREINFVDTFFVPQSYYDNLKDERKARQGDVLYTVTGSYGIPVIVVESKPFCFQRHIALLRPNNDFLMSQYLCYWALMDSVKQMADDVATGIAQKTVGLSSLRKFMIAVPPLSLQQEFAQKIEVIESMKAKVRQSLKESEILFNSRMDYYFN